MPANLKPLAAAAKDQHRNRPAPPEIVVTGTSDAWDYACPYRAGDVGDWEALLYSAFGTRSMSAARTFVDQLARLCLPSYDQGAGAWRPSQAELNTAVAIVNSTRPENEAQAALAAQAVAVHFASMRLAEQAVRYCYSEPRTVAIQAKLARTYAGLLEALGRLQGRKATRQDIHVHNHQHVHFEGASPETGGQPHTSKEFAHVHNTSGADSNATGGHEQRPALPSPCSDGAAVPGSGGEGEAGMPNAWRTWLRRALRRG